MILIENTEVHGWQAAIRGMRNPLNSWEKSDSEFGKYNHEYDTIGAADRALMMNLVRAGSDHSKFMRMIVATADITAPLYWWKEFDTYKVGTVRNSCSTMHTIHKRYFTKDDFSFENVPPDVANINEFLGRLNYALESYTESNSKKYWYAIIQLLPSSYNQRATVQMNYAVLRNMYHARKNHKLDEWHDFCAWAEALPQSELITDKEGGV